jgi:hypothetical protein
MTEQQISSRGVEASQILESAVYQEAMEALRAAIVNKWKECPLRDKEGQTLSLQMMRLADTFEGLLRGYVEAGKYANHQIDLNAARAESPARRILNRVL